MLESVLAGTVLHGVKSGVLTSAAVISKQMITETSKQAYKSVKPAAPPAFGRGATRFLQRRGVRHVRPIHPNY